MNGKRLFRSFITSTTNRLPGRAGKSGEKTGKRLRQLRSDPSQCSVRNSVPRVEPVAVFYQDGPQGQRLVVIEEADVPWTNPLDEHLPHLRQRQLDVVISK